MQIDREDLRAALLKKGFEEDAADHMFYTLVVDGKKTSVFTKLSHSSKYKTYNDNLIDFVKAQMHLTKKDLVEFVDCTLTYIKYVELLRSRDFIR